MKTLLSLVIALLLIGTSVESAFAHDHSSKAIKKGYLVKNNQLVELKRGKLFPVKQPLALKNGYTLHPNGAITSPEGFRRNLREGEGIDKEGHILFAGKKDGRLVLVDSPVNFYALFNGGEVKEVKTVTGIKVEDIKMR